MRGVLTKLGDTFDRLTGRGWQPSSSLATSELIERLKKLLDSEVKIVLGEGKYVPHNIKLKMQWDKFSTDSGNAIASLENELLTAAVDHINDNLYHTYAPLKFEVKPDYFTEGVRLLASFETFAEEPHEAELNVTIPAINVAGLLPAVPEAAPPVPNEQTFIAAFNTPGGPRNVKLVFGPNQRKSVGRTDENDLALDDQSVSKVHASLVVTHEGRLMVADTGSTNGTFVNSERISYGKAYPVTEADVVKFGEVDVRFEYIVPPPVIPIPLEALESDAALETVSIGDFEFRTKSPEREEKEPLPTAVMASSSTESTSTEVPASDAPPSITEAFSRSDDAELAAIPRPAISPSPKSEIVSIDWNALLDEAEDEQEKKDS